MVSWTGWRRVWPYVAIFVVLAGINVFAFLFNVVPGESTTSSFPVSSCLDEALKEQPYSDRSDTSLSLNSEPAHEDGSDSYSACVPIIIGDDSNRRSDSALPFPLLYRLFNSAKEEISKKLDLDNGEKSSKLRSRSASAKNEDQSLPLKLLVVVDIPTLVCKMARDSLQDGGSEFQARVELTCLTVKELAESTTANGTLPKRKSLSCNTVVVGKSTRFIPQFSLQWAQFIKYQNLKVVDLDIPDASRAPPTVPRELWQPTVTTAFSSNHLAVGLLLLRSVARAGMELAKAGKYNISIVAYTLEDFDPTLQGYVDCLVSDLNQNYSIPTEVRKFDFAAHPDWMRVNQSMGYEGTGKWAWKAVIMHDLLVRRGFVVWTDAGCRYTTPALLETLDYTRDHGFASKSSNGFVPYFVHPGQIKYFRYQVKYGRAERVRNCDASGFGLTLDKYEDIIRPFYDCSLTKQCVGPDGASRDDHRFEQAALTLIADMNNATCQGLSSKVRRNMDYHQQDYGGTFPTHCYKDPLPVPAYLG